MEKFNFDGLFTYDLANNHQGDFEHGLNIINAMGEITRASGVRGALKFQFRQLETFIHPEFKQKKDVKHIPRFMETALTKEQYRQYMKSRWILFWTLESKSSRLPAARPRTGRF